MTPPAGDNLVETYRGLPIYWSATDFGYYTIHDTTRSPSYGTVLRARQYIDGIVDIAPPVTVQPPVSAPEPEPGGESEQLNFIGGLLGAFGQPGALAKDSTVAGKVAGPVGELLRTLGLTPEAVAAVSASPLNRDLAAQLATGISQAAQVGLGLICSIGVVAEVASLGQIESVTQVIQNVLTNIGLDKVLNPIFTAPFFPSIITPTLQYWRSKYPSEIPQQQDLITFVVREVIGPADFKKWMLYHGFDGTWSDAYWEAHWKLPSITDVIDAEHRGVITRAERDRFFVLHDYRPTARPGQSKSDLAIYGALTKEPIPRVDVRRGFKLGDITEAEMLARYKGLGYETDAELMAKIQKRAAFESMQDAVIREAMYLLGAKRITEADFDEIYGTARDAFDELLLWKMRAQLWGVRMAKAPAEPGEEPEPEEEAEERLE